LPRDVRRRALVDLPVDGRRRSRAVERDVASRVHGVARELVQRNRVLQEAKRENRCRTGGGQHRAGKALQGRATAAGSLTEARAVRLSPRSGEGRIATFSALV